jgi:hypothetical protein
VYKFNLVPVELAAMRALKLPAPVFLTRLTGVCEIVGCLMLGLGIAPGIAAVALALFTFSSASCSGASGPQGGYPGFSPPMEHLLQQSRDERGATLRRRGGSRSLFADLIAGIKEEQQS